VCKLLYKRFYSTVVFHTRILSTLTTIGDDIARVNEIIEPDRRATVDDIAGNFFSSAQTIVTEHLEYREVCTWQDTEHRCSQTSNACLDSFCFIINAKKFNNQLDRPQHNPQETEKSD